MSASGWVEAQSLKIGDQLVTISSEHIDVATLSAEKMSGPLGELVSFTNTEIVSIEAKTAKLVAFNDLTTECSITQPVMVKTADGVSYKNAGDVVIGDVLVVVDAEGAITETVITSTFKTASESEVYDVRTSPQPWFITKSFIAIA